MIRFRHLAAAFTVAAVAGQSQCVTATEPAELQKELQQKRDVLFELRIHEKTLLENLGPQHPKVIETQQKIELISDFLLEAEKDLAAPQKEYGPESAELNRLQARRQALGHRLRDTDDEAVRIKLKAELQELERLQQRLTQARREHRRPPHEREVDELHHKLSALERETEEVEDKLRSTDDGEEKEELEEILHKLHREQDELRHALHERGHRDEPDRRRENHDPELREHMERVRAMHEAAERLERGGVHDMAREIHRQAEELEREIHHHRQNGRAREEAFHELMENVHELREEVNELHHKLDEIMEFIEELHEHEDHDDDDEDDDDDVAGLTFPFKRAMPAWWNAASRAAYDERLRAKKDSQKVFLFGGVAFNR